MTVAKAGNRRRYLCGGLSPGLFVMDILLNPLDSRPDGPETDNVVRL
jgi:hypothetical protein